MKNSKKIKLGKLNFYIIDDNYINYLSQFDKLFCSILPPNNKTYVIFLKIT